jgi:hypothetical protein
MSEALVGEGWDAIGEVAHAPRRASAAKVEHVRADR